jgi:hypothetical protein
MPDYENDIVFKPELTWEELCEWAVKELNAMEFFSVMTGSKSFELRGLEFNDLGIIKIKETGSILAKNKTPEQMKTIIQALYEE